MTQPIFIHIPKTGGTTINCAMQGIDWQSTPDYHYRHIIYETKKSNCGDIFDVENNSQYKDEFIFTMLRHPVDRLISEFYFLRKHDEFMSLLNTRVNRFEDYVELDQTANYMVKFLCGKSIYSDEDVNQSDLDNIIQCIESLDIRVGIFEEYERSLSYFTEQGGVVLPEEMAVKRATIHRPKKESINAETKETILRKNNLDYQLYQYCLKRLHEKSQPLTTKKYLFKGGQYEHILPYTTRFCILEIALKNSRFIQVNKNFLVTMNVYLHKTTQDGKTYAKQWVKLFKSHVQYYYPNTTFAKQIKKTKKRSPIDDIIAIASIIDELAKQPSSGLDLNVPQLKFRMTSEMEQVFNREGLVNTRPPQW